jgi:1-aminocyclopropane-1-carboxylate deaminase/D-cysteine desulfhydrase-like pyridoxal-dependent ACC family enzyme
LHSAIFVLGHEYKYSHMNLAVRPELVTIDMVELSAGQSIEQNVLRLDRIHPIVSGNKWFKLQEYLRKAMETGSEGILTFGGPFSNHIVAAAFAARAYGLRSRGIIRGEEPKIWSPTLRDASEYGMDLIFVAREDYRSPEGWLKKKGLLHSTWTTIPEGGAGPEGRKGAAAILKLVPALETYSHICCAVGTGTMLAGIIQSALPHQQLVGISSLKGKDELTPAICSWVGTDKAPFRIFFDFHFGGYARYTEGLLAFMRELYQKHNLPTDFVYTGKLMYGIRELSAQGYFPPGSKLLIIHSGGLQGNRSLDDKELIFFE